MRYWKKRAKLLWKFTKLIPHARELELEIQRMEQTMHDLEFANQYNAPSKEKDLAYQKGYVDGVKWCVEHYS
jgi:hypothetical protein